MRLNAPIFGHRALRLSLSCRAACQDYSEGLGENPILQPAKEAGTGGHSAIIATSYPILMVLEKIRRPGVKAGRKRSPGGRLNP
jgi:hypothetical protein